MRVLAGRNAHHVVEAQFKAVARALRDAVALDPRVGRGAVDQGRCCERPSRRVVVLDYGSGNLRSAERALARVGADVDGDRRRGRGAGADGLVVPGVGAFAACMAGLRAVGGHALVGRRSPADGPCSASASACRCCSTHGVEHGVDDRGVGEWPGVVERLRRRSCRTWAGTPSTPPAGSRLFAGVEGERFYFVHSYAVRAGPATGGARAPR